MPILYYKRHYIYHTEHYASLKLAAQAALAGLEAELWYPDRIEDDEKNVVWKTEGPFTVSDSLEKFADNQQ